MLARQPAERLADIRRRGGIHARERGDSDRAIRLLVEAGAWDAVLGTVRATLVQLGVPEDPALARAVELAAADVARRRSPRCCCSA